MRFSTIRRTDIRIFMRDLAANGGLTAFSLHAPLCPTGRGETPVLNVATPFPKPVAAPFQAP
jgi:hypothetical protein